jgi:hypothetical protein
MANRRGSRLLKLSSLLEEKESAVARSHKASEFQTGH